MFFSFFFFQRSKICDLKKNVLRDYDHGNHGHTESRSNIEIIFKLRIGKQSESWKLQNCLFF